MNIEQERSIYFDLQQTEDILENVMMCLDEIEKDISGENSPYAPILKDYEKMKTNFYEGLYLLTRIKRDILNERFGGEL